METEGQRRWARFKKYFREYPEIGLSLDISRMNFEDGFFESMAPRFERAFRDMAALEAGAIANPDEKRMVGHYWLRAPESAPTREITEDISSMHRAIQEFVVKVHSGAIRGAHGKFQRVILIGIGGSALGPQFVSDAVGNPSVMPISFLDNTDPDGIDRVLTNAGDLGVTLCLIVSKSGGTKETRNGMLETKCRYESQGVRFATHAVAITGRGSELDLLAEKENWVARFPMWDWVGGRTSETSAVGLLPAALEGIDINALLEGARLADELTRSTNSLQNPAAMMASMWFAAGNGRGERDMVILPYKDSLSLFSRYLQQLVMESLGKSIDFNDQRVNQGIAVYGNKGSTDQHAYIQQLRDGLDNHFVTFIEVLKDKVGSSIEVEPSVTTGDFLSGFMHGTREALTDSGRNSITVSIDHMSPRTVGSLIAIFERAVGLYASLVNINAYHQPGVEAGKKAATRYIETQQELIQSLRDSTPTAVSAEELAARINRISDIEAVRRICDRLAHNGRLLVLDEQASGGLNRRYFVRCQPTAPSHASTPT